MTLIQRLRFFESHDLRGTSYALFSPGFALLRESEIPGVERPRKICKLLIQKLFSHLKNRQTYIKMDTTSDVSILPLH